MILEKCYSSEWITQQRKLGLGANPQIIEKSIRALGLLSNLAQTGLDFLFKGGTSLLLHLRPIRRLSIDIDIVCDTSQAGFEDALRNAAVQKPFTEYSEDDRGERGLPRRRHFKYNYEPLAGGDRQPVILLDVLEEKECALPLVHLPIKADFIETDNDLPVKVPTIEGLLGDKLTAFAPNTTGVPYETRAGKSQAIQVAKQLFDVGELFNAAGNVSELVNAYRSNHLKESGYRENKHSLEASLRDTIGTCYQFCGQRLKNFPTDYNAEKLASGCTALQKKGNGSLK